jgi:serine/threonine protein kinase/tetratricopeptide (TPR) repeat protein
MIGTTISHYKILQKIGEGGMGVVYKAHDTMLDRVVALKFLPHYLTSDHVEKERFYHEARAASALMHPNVTVIYEIAEHDGQLYIAMELVEGQTLRNLVMAIHESPLQMKKILDIAIQVCDGLVAAHEKGIVHRDIKGDNIMLTSKGQAKIMDFGLAKLKGATKLTKAGSTLGTAAYMSPEQARGEEVDQRSDIFSLGVVLYEMLTTHLPFRGEHVAAIQYSIVNEEPAPLARYNEKITDELQHIVSKALEKDRDDRYQHVDEMLADLRRERKHLEYARTGYATTTGKPTIATHPPVEAVSQTLGRKRLTKLFAAIGIVAVLAIAFFLLRPFILEEAISSERRTVAVISFINQTGENSYDYLQDAIPNLLITNLEQSKYLRVATWERLYDLRKQIGKTDTKFIDRDIGFELCKMDDIEAIVLGSFTKAGDVFATDVKVLDVRTKQLLKSANSKGDGVGSILKTQIDELSKEISRGIGLSERKIESTPMQIMEVTTSSMEAYNFFLRGRDDYHRFYFEEARKYLERAVSIDSAFAIAYVNLAFTCERLNDYNASIMAYQKAARYYQRTPERERLMVEAALAVNVEKNRDKAFNLLKEVTEKYPKFKWGHYWLGVGSMYRNMTSEAIAQLTIALQLDPEFGPALNQLGYVYARIGEYDKAIDCFKRYAAVNPGDPNPFDSMAELYFRMGKLDDAIAKYNEVLDIKPDFGATDLCLAYVNMLKEDFDKSIACTDRFIAQHSSPGLKASGYWIRALMNYYAKGKLNQSMKDIEKAQELFRSVGDERWIVLGDLLKGAILYDRHETTASRELFDKFFSYEIKNNPLGSGKADWAFACGMLALAEARIPEARSKLKELDSLLLQISPRYITKILRNQREVLYAELFIAEDSVDEAVRVIEKAGPPDLPNFNEESMFSYNAPSSRDVAARAYTKKGALDKAITEYEKIIKFDPNSNDRRFILPKYHHALAKLYEKQGLREKAVEQYNRLLILWKDADPDLPELKDAKLRLIKLKAKAAK